MNVDTFLDRDRNFWNALQTICVAECCGIDAFDFSEESLVKTAQSFDAKSISKNLEELIKFLKENTKKTISIESWNQHEHKNEFIKLFQNIKRVLLRVSE